MELLTLIIMFLVALFLGKWFGLIEGWASSPATMIQLASSSGYYPFWRYGYGYRYPYYRFMYPYNEQNPTYGGMTEYRSWPRPYGSFSYY